MALERERLSRRRGADAWCQKRDGIRDISTGRGVRAAAFVAHQADRPPLASADAPHQTIGKAVGLAVFASDNLSSVAYATDEILFVLAAAGTAAFVYTVPIALCIIALLVILTVSYRQTIHAYPGGGGAYIVARDNLGELPAQTAGAALLTDYILTVSVSIASGVAQITSAYPALFPYRVILSVGLVLFMMLINLRGVRESGLVFAGPTYFFVIMLFLTVGSGLAQFLMGSLGAVDNPPPLDIVPSMQSATLFLLLHAFSNGTTAVTGVEAISNGVQAFKEPRSRNAGITLIWMAAILGTLFLSISFLARQIGAIPSEAETVISQLARTTHGGVACCISPRLRLRRSSSSWRPTPRLPISPGSAPLLQGTASCPVS
ncbi:MAG: amino acid permease [Candidatus Methylomirabilis sp.]|nr:amino acid permease [Candidatus Methylomirabilis sp.]